MDIAEVKNLFVVGSKFEVYYGNGDRQYIYGTDIPVVETVTRVNNKSCWVGKTRRSWNTIKEYYEIGIFRIQN